MGFAAGCGRKAFEKSSITIPLTFEEFLFSFLPYCAVMLVKVSIHAGTASLAGKPVFIFFVSNDAPGHQSCMVRASSGSMMGIPSLIG
jgi:hypothetical protein